MRIKVLKVLCNAGSGHTGGSLSVIDIFVALYYRVMNIDPKDPDWSNRDRLVLGKGHSCPALYCILADLGYFPEKYLEGLRQYDCNLQGSRTARILPGLRPEKRLWRQHDSTDLYT